MSSSACCWCGAVLQGEPSLSGAACLCPACCGQAERPAVPSCSHVMPPEGAVWWQDHAPAVSFELNSPSSLPERTSARPRIVVHQDHADTIPAANSASHRTALAWCAGLAGVILVIASGLLVLAGSASTGDSTSELVDEPTSFVGLNEVAESSPASAARAQAGTAKGSQTIPETLARSHPALGQTVGWAKGDSAPQHGLGKVALNKPVLVARSTPAPGERVGWAKSEPIAGAPKLSEEALLAQLAFAPRWVLAAALRQSSNPGHPASRATSNSTAMAASRITDPFCRRGRTWPRYRFVAVPAVNCPVVPR